MFNWLSNIDPSIRSLKQHKINILLILLSVTLSSSSFAATVGHWKFESGIADVAAIGPGSIIDSSGKNNHGTPVGNPVYRNDVPINPIPQTLNSNSLSLEFTDGSEIYFDSTFIFHEPGDASIEFWIKTPAFDHAGVFWTRADDGDLNRFHFFIDADNIFGLDYRSPSGVIHPLIKASIPGDTWVHLAIVRLENTYSIYRDGLLVGASTDINPDLPTSKGWQLSGRTGYTYIGNIDSLRFSDVALQPHEFLNAIGNTNTTPVAIAGTSLDQNFSIQLDASLSSDNDNDLLNYSWLIGGETVPQFGSIVPITHLEAGDYTVTLTVDDGKGGISMDSMLLAIPNSTIESNQDIAISFIQKLKEIRELAKNFPPNDTHSNKKKAQRKRPILKAIEKVAAHIFAENFKAAYYDLLFLEEKLSGSDSQNRHKTWIYTNDSPIFGLVTDVISDLLEICGDCSQPKHN